MTDLVSSSCGSSVSYCSAFTRYTVGLHYVDLVILTFDFLMCNFSICVTLWLQHYQLWPILCLGFMRPRDLDHIPFDLEVISRVTLAMDNACTKFELSTSFISVSWVIRSEDRHSWTEMLYVFDFDLDLLPQTCSISYWRHEPLPSILDLLEL